MNTILFLSTLTSLALIGSSVYMYFNHHFGATTTLAIVGVGLFQFAFALVVMLRLSKPYDASKNGYSPTASFTPTNMG